MFNLDETGLVLYRLQAGKGAKVQLWLAAQRIKLRFDRGSKCVYSLLLYVPFRIAIAVDPRPLAFEFT